MGIRQRWDRNRAVNAARRALHEGRLEEAEQGFARLAEDGLDDPSTWFNLGLARKFLRDWAGSVEANRRSAELRPSEEAFYNMGVAATAIRDWPSARWAWRGLGLEDGRDEGPPEMSFGLAPVRLNATPDGGGEVVWGFRIDPCRMRLESVPMPESGHRWGDVVLHDVVPRGERRAAGRVYSVFDELARMDPSPHPTLEVEVTAPTEADGEALGKLFAERDLGAEDWTGSIRWLCAACSLAEAHTHEGEQVIREPWTPARRFGVAGDRDRIVAALATWAAARSGRAAGEPRPVEGAASHGGASTRDP